MGMGSPKKGGLGQFADFFRKKERVAVFEGDGGSYPSAHYAMEVGAQGYFARFMLLY